MLKQNTYYILSAFHSEMYELTAAVNDVGILVISKISPLKAEEGLAGYKEQKEWILGKIFKLKEVGTIVLVEEAIDAYSINSTKRLLTEKIKGGLARDIYFEHFLAMYPRQLYIPDDYVGCIPKEWSEFEIITDDKGVISYKFRNEIAGEFRAILLLISAFVYRPFDITAVKEMFSHDNVEIPEEDRTIQSLLNRKSTWNAETEQQLAEIASNFINQTKFQD